MLEDVQAVTRFYSTRRGRVAARLLCRHLRTLWPDLSNQRLLGLGHTAPFLPLWRTQATLCVDAATTRSPQAGVLGASCLVQEDELPFRDLSFERVLMAHALENAAEVTHTLRAVWRVMADDGRLLIMVPNRTGLWAHNESTPFADGAPYSVGRIGRVLARGLFRIERLHGALYWPPVEARPLLRLGQTIETAGRRLPANLAGVFLIEAVKDVYAAMPVAATRRGMVRRRVLAPVAARDGWNLTGAGEPSMNRDRCPPLLNR